VLLLVTGCSLAPTAASTHPSPSSSAAPSATRPAPSASTIPPPTEDPSPSPPLPAGVPRSFAQDVPARQLPLSALIPPRAHPEGSWIAEGAAGGSVLVAYALPSPDPFRAERGVVLWRRTGGDPPWQAGLARREPASAGVLSITAQIADVTGDGAPDALVNEATGGSGTCATWRVIDLAAGAWVFGRALCDGTIQPNLDPVGLLETSAVYRPGDPHCCPSAFRARVLTYRDQGGWGVASSRVTPA
jgi:hypothetical protein